VADALRNIYRVPTEAAALDALRELERSPSGARYPTNCRLSSVVRDGALELTRFDWLMPTNRRA